MHTHIQMHMISDNADEPVHILHVTVNINTDHNFHFFKLSKTHTLAYSLIHTDYCIMLSQPTNNYILSNSIITIPRLC